MHPESCPEVPSTAPLSRIRDFDCPRCQQAMRWPGPVTCHSPDATLACPHCGIPVTVSVAIRFEYLARVAD